MYRLLGAWYHQPPLQLAWNPTWTIDGSRLSICVGIPFNGADVGRNAWTTDRYISERLTTYHIRNDDFDGTTILGRRSSDQTDTDPTQ